MHKTGICKFFCGAVLFSFAFALVLLPQQADSKLPQDSNAAQSAADESVPAFHEQPPRADRPATMNPDFFTEPVVQNAYAVAAKIKKILYQQPCYCHCDRKIGRAHV